MRSMWIVSVKTEILLFQSSHAQSPVLSPFYSRFFSILFKLYFPNFPYMLCQLQSCLLFCYECAELSLNAVNGKRFFSIFFLF